MLELPADSHRTISADGKTISYKGVVKEATQVLQCKASNIHGYVFENAVLNVICKWFITLSQTILNITITK